MSNWQTKNTDELFQVVAALKNKAEAKNFLRDLLTEQELVEFGKRWKAARMLSDKVSYTEIVKQTGLSSTTVARVSQWLSKGMGGYKLAISRLASASSSSSVHHHTRILP